MMLAWFSSSEMTASSGPSRVSNRPPLASKQELYRIASSVPRNSREPPLQLLVDLRRAADEADRRHAEAPAVQRLRAASTIAGWSARPR